eukprot:11184916-Alexandrium_andersonii.AAC.1
MASGKNNPSVGCIPGGSSLPISTSDKGSASVHCLYHSMEVGWHCASAGGGLPRALGCGRRC